MTHPATDTPRLRLADPDARARALGLAAQDALLAVNGAPFPGSAAQLTQWLAQTEGQDLLLGFRRDGVEFGLIVPGGPLGRWEGEGGTGAAPARGTPPLWQVMADRQGRYDVFARGPSLFALLAPPVWLATMRLWGVLAAVCIAVLTGLAVGWPVAVLIHACIALHLWQAAPDYLRRDRMARGMTPLTLIAARSEAKAHATAALLHPGLRFNFSRDRPPQDAPAG